MLKERSKLHKVNQEAYALLLKELLTGPCPTSELAEVSGLHSVTVQSLMRVLVRHGIVHVGAWDPDARGADTIAVWKFGPGRAAKRRKKTRAEIASAYRARKQSITSTMKGITP